MVGMFSVHLDATGKERHYTYVQSRLFYCAWYEKLAPQQQAFAKLKADLAAGGEPVHMRVRRVSTGPGQALRALL